MYLEKKGFLRARLWSCSSASGFSNLRMVTDMKTTEILRKIRGSVHQRQKKHLRENKKLYERLLQVQKEKIELLESLLKETK